jgi:formylglycine-generating enzyme required for sulfatase activity
VDNTIPFGTTSNPATGVFIFRSTNGFGNFETLSNKIRWNYVADGITNATTLEVSVYAIEMVYVPTGPFNVGGGLGPGAFISTTINSADAKLAPSGTGSLGGQAGGYPTGQNPPSFSTWPNGYNAFYCMKYEITQQQYVDFLNSLTPAQSFNRVDYFVYYGYGWFGNRYGLSGNGNGLFTTIFPDVACGFITMMDGVAYSEWAGLRPLTELEYEKACRGNQVAVQYEYAWGNSDVVSQSYSLFNLDQPTEGVLSNYSSTVGNANVFAPQYHNGSSFYGPFRVGIFASNGASTGRVSAGASYWGIMELTGNLLEPYISIQDGFGGRHGIGALTADGNPITFTPTYLVFKGGGWGHYSWPVSRRDLYLISLWNRENGMGFRSGRSE